MFMKRCAVSQDFTGSTILASHFLTLSQVPEAHAFTLPAREASCFPEDF